MERKIEILDSELWFEGLMGLAERCRNGEPSADLVAREFRTLLTAAPTEVGTLASPMSEAEFDAMMECGATLDAVLAIVDLPHGLMLSRSPGGTAIASVTLPGGKKESTFTARDMTVAYCAAFCGALFRLYAGKIAPAGGLTTE